MALAALLLASAVSPVMLMGGGGLVVLAAFAAGAVSAAGSRPRVTLGLVAGVVADRVDRRTLALTADIGRMLAVGVVALLGVLGKVPPLWLLALVVLVLGTGHLLFGVAFSAWLPDV